MTEVSGYGTLNNKYTTSWSMTDKGGVKINETSVELTQQTTRHTSYSNLLEFSNL